MKIKQVIIIADMPPVYEIRTYQLNKFLEFETVLGENIRRFTPTDDNSDIVQLLNKPLFPKARVQPIIINDLTKDTMVILALRENHYLINTSFSTSDLSKEVLFDPNKNNLNYLFFNFTTQSLTINPRIEEDKIGALKYFGENLEDNLIRETILGFMHLPKAPNESIKRMRAERADNLIIYDDETIVIKYNSGKTLRVMNEAPVRDILFLIQNKISTSDVAELWGKLRNIKYEDHTIATNNFQKSKSRLLKNLRAKEIKNGIPPGQRFSEFVEKFININSGNCSISYEAPEEIRWEFYPPENLYN